MDTRYFVVVVGALGIGLFIGLGMMISDNSYGFFEIFLGFLTPPTVVAVYALLMKQGKPPNWDVDLIMGLVCGSRISKRVQQPVSPLRDDDE